MADDATRRQAAYLARHGLSSVPTVRPDTATARQAAFLLGRTSDQSDQVTALDDQGDDDGPGAPPAA